MSARGINGGLSDIEIVIGIEIGIVIGKFDPDEDPDTDWEPCIENRY